MAAVQILEQPRAAAQIPKQNGGKVNRDFGQEVAREGRLIPY